MSVHIPAKLVSDIHNEYNIYLSQVEKTIKRWDSEDANDFIDLKKHA